MGEAWIVKTLREELYYICAIIHKEMVTDEFIDTLKRLEDSEKRQADEKIKHIDVTLKLTYLCLFLDLF